MSFEVTIVVGAFLLIAALKSLLLKGETSWKLYKRGSDSYLKWVTATLSMFASMAGGFMIFGLVQMGYEGGFTAYIIGLAYVLGMPLLILGFKRASSLSVIGKGVAGIDNLVKIKYGKSTHILFNVLNILLFGGILAGQFVAIAFYLKTFLGIENYIIVIVIGCILTVLYTSLLGLRGVIANDIIQAIFIVAVSIIIPFSLKGFNISNLGFQELVQGKISGDYTLLFPLFGFLFLIPSFVVRADLWQRLRITSQKGQKAAIISCSLLLLWFYFIMSSIGRAIKLDSSLINNQSISEAGNIVPMIIQTVISNPVTQVVCLTGILFALLSSIDAYLNIVSVTVVKLIMTNIWEKEEDTQEENIEYAKMLKVNARVTTIIVAFVAAGIAVLIPDIVDILSASFSGIGVLLPIVLGALYFKRRFPDWLGASTIAVALLVLIVSLPFLEKISFIPSIISGVIVYCIGLTLIRKSSKVSS